MKLLAEFRHVILVGCREPVILRLPGKPGTPVPPDAELHILARPEQDPADALARLADELAAAAVAMPDPGPRPSQPVVR